MDAFNRYNEILYQFNETIPYVIIGTYALYKLPEKVVLNTLPNDVDIIIPNDMDILNKAIRTLIFNGYKVYSWKDRINENFDLQLFNGRFYIRAIQTINDKCYTFDITYESTVTEFNQLYATSNLIDNLRVASIENILALFAARKNNKDTLLISKINSLFKFS